MAPTPPPWVSDGLCAAAGQLVAHGWCGRCIGRAFAGYGHGLTNPQRMELLLPPQVRTWLPAEADCPLCLGILIDIARLARLVVEASAPYEFQTLAVGALLDRSPEDAQGMALAPLGDVAKPEPLRREFNREVGKGALALLPGKTADVKMPDLVVQVDPLFLRTRVQVRSTYFAGRYRKLVRDIPQTHWPCRSCRGHGCDECEGTGVRYAISVEGLVAPTLIEACGGSGARFHGMGREDIDVRMLGRGRPFVIEVLEPTRRTIDVPSMESRINDLATGRVEVLQLRVAARELVSAYKDEGAQKSYHLTVVTDTPLIGASLEALRTLVPSLQGITLEQRTPRRVSHRRADLVRQRRVVMLRIDTPADSWERGSQFEMTLRAQSGTYIKEFISGDGGRTVPSVSSHLGVPARAEALDVIAVHDKDEDTPQGAEG